MRICLLLFVLLGVTDYLSAQQVSPALASLLNSDQRELSDLRRNISYLPKNLRNEIATVDSLLERICRDTAYGINCPKRDINVHWAQKNLLKLADDIDALRREERALEKVFAEQKRYINEHPDMSVKAYREYRKQCISPGFIKCKKLFRSIKRREGFFIRWIYRYIRRRYWSANPMATTVVRNYLAGMQDFELRKTAVELKQTRSTLQKYIAQRTELELQQTVLERTNDSLKNERRDLNYQKMMLDLRINEGKDSVVILNQKIVSIEMLIRLNDFRLTALGDSIASVEKQRTIAEASLDGARRQLTGMQGQINQMSGLLRSKTDSMALMERLLSQTEERVDKLEAGKRRNRQLFIAISLLLGALILLLLYQRLTNEQRARKALQQVNEQLSDKSVKLETLLRELHHRTKNNLQQVSALLLLQGRDSGDARVREVLSEARSRIDALGMVHRQLYQDSHQRYDAIHLPNYISELATQLLRGSNAPANPVETRFDIPDIRIDTDTTVQIGLIINELIQNAMKHAFPGHSHPTMTIQVAASAGWLSMTVRDNGPGLPPDFDPKQAQSFGLKLVNMLAKNTLECQSDQGAIFTLKLPYEHESA